MGIFDAKANVFTTYHAELQFRDKIMGGTPKDPKIIMSWLRSKMGIEDLMVLRTRTLETVQELGIQLGRSQEEIDAMSVDELWALSEKLGATKQTNGFKVDPERGLYIEGRTVKSMLKECTNILFAGQTWLKRDAKLKTGEANPEGAYRGKGPRSVVAERVFVNPDKIWLGVTAPTGIDLFIGHTMGPNGPQSNLTYYEYVFQPRVEFDVMVAKDFMTMGQWAELWVHAQENGLGALRSQGFGRFDIEAWDTGAARIALVS